MLAAGDFIEITTDGPAGEIDLLSGHNRLRYKSMDIHSVTADKVEKAELSLQLTGESAVKMSLDAVMKSGETLRAEYDGACIRHPGQMFGSEKFNNARHSASILSNGISIMEGVAHLTQVKANDRWKGYYSLTIIGSTFDWMESAKAKISELPVTQSLIYTLPNVYSNSVLPQSSVPLIRFIPVDRGAYYVVSATGKNEYADRTAFDIRDYHPFLNVWAVLNLIFEKYTVKTSLEETFKRLYFSGTVTKVDDISEIKERNNFEAWGGTSDRISIEGIKTVPIYIRWRPSTLLEWIISGSVREITGFRPVDDVNVSFNIHLNYSTSVTPEGAFADTFIFGEGIAQSVYRLKASQCSDAWEMGLPVEGGPAIIYIDTKETYPAGVLMEIGYLAPGTLNPNRLVRFLSDNVNFFYFSQPFENENVWDIPKEWYVGKNGKTDPLKTGEDDPLKLVSKKR